MAIKGIIGNYKDGVLNGWAFNTEKKEIPVHLELIINNQQHSDCIADQSRHKFKESGLHPTGNCGFSINIPEALILESELNALEVIEKESKNELTNSPYFIDNRKHNERVLIVGLNKSGTSILTYRIAAGIQAKHIYFEPKSNQGLNNYKHHIKFTSFSKVVTKCLYHHGNSKYLSSISGLYDKKVWIVRDPRDVIISSFLYMWYKGHNKPLDRFNIAYQNVLKKEANPEDISFYNTIKGTINIRKYIKERIEPIVQKIKTLDDSWHILKYEDFMVNNDSALNKYLGFKIDRETEVGSQVKRVSRSNSFDNWRRWFTEEDTAKLSELLNPFLKELGYDHLDWKLDSKPVLDPKVGSQYMYKLYHD